MKRFLRKLYMHKRIFSFSIRKRFLGFDIANQYIQRVDKSSISRILTKYGAKIGDECDIETGLIFHNCTDYSNLTIGNNCHIGKQCFFDLRDKIVIKDNVVISMQTTFITHIDMTKSSLSELYPASSKEIIIEDNCYIGVNSTILMGVELRETSFVAANSLVIKNVDSQILVGGVPANKIMKLNGIKKTD